MIRPVVAGSAVDAVVGAQATAETRDPVDDSIVKPPVATPVDARGTRSDEATWYADELGAPGAFPFTRGISAEMYRSSPWVMGMYSGRASPEQTNRRIRALLQSGQTGFSIALDLPTQLGMDSDDPRARGEVGRVGVPLDSVHDMVALLRDVPFEQVRQIRTTANAIGPIALALFVVAAERLGYAATDFKVLLQNDVLKEYLSRNTHIFPVRRGRDFSVDVVEHCARYLPHWEPIEFCGYHIREAGSTAVQEVAIAIANGIEYLDCARERGIEIDHIGHSLYMFLSAGLDLFEEVAKFRAARRVWARLMRERYDVRTDAACALNIFCYTLGSSQTAQEPLNNLTRIAYQAMAAALGGVQTLATSSFDEAVTLPSPEAAHLGLRTQQILAWETGVTASADPLGGSYLVETLTNELESHILAYVQRISDLGGAVAAIDNGFLERDIADEAMRLYLRRDRGEATVVGVNSLVDANAPLLDYRTTEPQADAGPLEQAQIASLQQVRMRRDPGPHGEALAAVHDAAAGGRNTVPSIIDAVRAEATVGEITDTLAAVWGRFRADHS
jgi:methylmalonyl-CoA mutase N-terminal domain/subunit